MTALWIALGVLALLFLLLMIRGDIHISYRDDVSATLQVLFLSFPLYPKKRRRVDPSRYSLRALKKKKRKAKKNKARSQKGQPSQENKNEKNTVGALSFLRKSLKVLLAKSFGYVRVRVSRVWIRVGSHDAAETALLFGAVNTAVIGLLEVLDSYGKFDGKRNAVLSVSPDFLAEKTTADIHIVLSFRIWHLLAILFHTFLAYLKNKTTENKA